MIWSEDMERARDNRARARAAITGGPSLTLMAGGVMPDGYRVRETNDRVAVQRTCLTQGSARRFVQRNLPIIPSYHLRVERRGFMRWDVVAYQNVLEPESLR